MPHTIGRLKTPPSMLNLANDKLMTPPPTGGSSKRTRIYTEPETPCKRFFGSKDSEEVGLSRYTEVQDISDNDEEVSVSDIVSEGFYAVSSPSTSSDSQSSNGAQPKIFEQTPVVEGPSLTGPFAFMKLPLKVRNRIYEFILVVPALICVRQNHTAYHAEPQAYLHVEHREFLPGIAYALVQVTVGGHKHRFTRLTLTNINILQVSKKVHAEAKAVMYNTNEFEIQCPSLELSPPPNFKVPLFPRGYQRLVHKLNIRIRSFYPLQWLINGGYAELKDAYRGLETLALMFEMETAKKGFGKRACRNEGEAWVPYVQRLRNILAIELYGKVELSKHIPIWIDFRVLFDGDQYGESAAVDVDATNMDSERAAGHGLRTNMQRGLAEAFELLKK